MHYPCSKTKALIIFAVTAKLVCVFVFAYADCCFFHEAAQIEYPLNQRHPNKNRHTLGLITCNIKSQQTGISPSQNTACRNTTWRVLFSWGGSYVRSDDTSQSFHFEIIKK